MAAQERQETLENRAAQGPPDSQAQWELLVSKGLKVVQAPRDLKVKLEPQEEMVPRA